MLTWKEAKDAVAEWAGRGGRCSTADDVGPFLRSVLEYMLLSGHYGNTRQFCFNARKGCFTLPYELEVPLKIKIDGEVGTAWDRWFTYHQNSFLDGSCLPAEAFFEDPNQYPTVYDLPEGGSKVGAFANCEELENAQILVQGTEANTGKEVVTWHKGQQLHGEVLSLKKGELRYTETIFGKITGINKSVTKGYVQLLWVKPEFSIKGFLADYSPLEEAPSYRRVKITSRHCGSCIKVSVLGRIRLKPAYADTDYIPFETRYTLQLAAQAINASYNKDIQGAQAIDKTMTDMIGRENEYKRINNGTPLEVSITTSAGAIKNIL
jgi:hypothetical protein